MDLAPGMSRVGLALAGLLTLLACAGAPSVKERTKAAAEDTTGQVSVLLRVAGPPGPSAARPTYFRLNTPFRTDPYSIDAVSLLADSSGYVVVGYNESSATRRRSIGVAAANGAGKQLWSRAYGVKRLVRELRALRTGDGGILVWGNEADAARPHLLRIGAKGESLWSRTYRGSFRLGEYGHPTDAIVQTSDGGFILAGILWDPNGKPAYLLKTDARGDTLWFKCFDNKYRLSLRSIQQTADGGCSMTGEYDGNACVVRIDGKGDVQTDNSGGSLWARAHDDRFAGDWARQTSDGGFVSVGHDNRSTSGMTGPGDIWAHVVRTNAKGDTLWTRSVGGTRNWGRWSVFKTEDDGLAIAALDPEDPLGNPYTGRHRKVGPESISIRVISVDPTGNVTRPEYPEQVLDFQEGLAPAKLDAKWGYVNEAAKFVIARQFDKAYHFSEGLAAVRVGDRWGFIGKDGRYVISPQFDDVDEFTYGLAPVSAGGKWGFVDTTGRLVVAPRFSRVSYLFGLGPVEIGDTWIYIDRTGNEVFRPEPSDVLPYAVAPHPAKLGGKWGYEDSTGTCVIAPQFDEARSFWMGLALVKADGEWGYIDKTGRYVWKEDGNKMK
jgi:hypothetical protein